MSLASCGGVEAREPPPHLIVVTLDTVRADHLGCYGYPRDTTPNLDALAGECLLFEQCVAPVSQTLPSHTTLFTGMQPREHGVLGNMGDRRMFVPAPGAPAIAEVLSGAGFRTAAFVAAEPVKEGGGLERGFQDWWQPEENQVRAEVVVDRTIEWIGDGLDGPTLLWVHLFDAHAPYDAPAPYAGRFGPDSALERHFAELDVRELEDRGQGRDEQFDAYDAEVAYVDAEVGRLVDRLRATGDLERAVLVVTGDHGEGLLQHGRSGHSGIWREMHRVPFLLRAPGLAPGVSPVVLGLRDVLPTALAVAPRLVELAREWSQRASGRSRLSATAGGPVFGQLPGGGLRQADFVEHEGWRLIAGPGKDRLYDLRRDPHELRNLAGRETAKLEELRAMIEEEARRSQVRGERFGAGETRPVDPRRRQALEELGYAGDEESDDD